MTRLSLSSHPHTAQTKSTPPPPNLAMRLTTIEYTMPLLQTPGRGRAAALDGSGCKRRNPRQILGARHHTCCTRDAG